MKKALIVLLAVLALVLIASCDNKAKTPEVSAALVGDKTTVTWNTDGKVKETAVTVKLTNACFDPLFSLSTSSDTVADFFTSGDDTLKNKGLSFTIATGDGSETGKPHTLKITIKDSGTASTAVTSYISGNYSLTIPSKYLKDDGAAVPAEGVTVKDAVTVNLLKPATVTKPETPSYGYDIKYDASNKWTQDTITLTLNNCTSTLSTDGEDIAVTYNCNTADYTLSGITCTATYTPKTDSAAATIKLEFSDTPHYSDNNPKAAYRTGAVCISVDSLKLVADTDCTLVTTPIIYGAFRIQSH